MATARGKQTTPHPPVDPPRTPAPEPGVHLRCEPEVEKNRLLRTWPDRLAPA